MAAVTYKCPNCDGGLKFDPASQKFKCDFCLSEFTKEELERLEKEGFAAEEEAKKKAPEEVAGGPAKMKAQAPGAVVYTCPSCGAEIVTDETTAATFCYYCHNPVVLSGRLSGDFLPDYVLPFAVDRDRAMEIFLNWIGKKKFVPHSFFSKDQIEKFTGVYFPYLLYSCKVEGKMTAEAEKNRVWVTGNMQYTEHKQYEVAREGELDVKNVTRNALKKSNRELVEGVLPYDLGQLKPFEMGYLSGFQAEKRDMDRDVFAREIEEEVKAYTIQNLQGSVDGGYTSMRVKDSEASIKDPKWCYALLPVWALTYQDKKRNKTYYFAMNGQNGKICGKLPADKGKLALLFAGVFFPMLLFLLIGGWFL